MCTLPPPTYCCPVQKVLGLPSLVNTYRCKYIHSMIRMVFSWKARQKDNKPMVTAYDGDIIRDETIRNRCQFWIMWLRRSGGISVSIRSLFLRILGRWIFRTLGHGNIGFKVEWFSVDSDEVTEEFLLLSRVPQIRTAWSGLGKRER